MGGEVWLARSSVLAKAQAETRNKGQPLHMTTLPYLTSQAQCSQYFESLTITVLLPPKSLPLNGQSSHPFPSILPHPDDLVALLPPEVWEEGVVC
jgi:hypothetical protein